MIDRERPPRCGMLAVGDGEGDLAAMSELEHRLAGVPAVALSETGGFSQPRGAVEVALGEAIFPATD